MIFAYQGEEGTVGTIYVMLDGGVIYVPSK